MTTDASNDNLPWLSWLGRARVFRSSWQFNFATQFLHVFELKEPVVINRVSMLRQLARRAPG